MLDEHRARSFCVKAPEKVLNCLPMILGQVLIGGREAENLCRGSACQV